METLDCLAARVSATQIDPERPLDGEDLRDLVRWACRAPSSFNLQPWRFVALTTPGERERLCRAAGADCVSLEAPVVLLVLGDLRACEDHAETLRLTVEKGDLVRTTADAWVHAAARYFAQPQAARDEAVRSAAQAAMCLMLAARDRGIASAAVQAFDGDALRREFAISDRYVPVMLIALGYPKAGDTQRQKVRLGLGVVLHEGTAEGLPD